MQTGVPGENFLNQRRELTILTHMWRQVWELNQATLVGHEYYHHWTIPAAVSHYFSQTAKH